MKNENKGVINIYITNTKSEDYFFNEIITKKEISNFNEIINSLFSKETKAKPIQINNRQIFLFFMNRYLYTKHFVYLLKQKNKKFLDNKSKNYLYLYTCFYVYINNEFIKPKLIDIKLLSVDKFFKLAIKFYKSKLLSLYHVINIFKLYLFLLTNSKTKLPMTENVNTLSNFIKYFWKLSKEIEFENDANNKEINDLIKEEILTKLFDILSGNQYLSNYFYLLHSFRKEENIFLLMKMIVERKFLSEENKSFIETNIIKYLENNFRKEHLNYLYKIVSDILIKFNYLNPKPAKKTDEKENYISINKRFEYLTKIIDILIKVIKEEKNQIQNISNYYCDKGFVFNLNDKDKIGCKVSDVSYNRNKKSAFCILFAFLLRDNDIKNENQVIFSIRDSEKEYLCLFSKGKEVYLRYYSSGKIYEIKIIDNIIYNQNYLFFFFYDKGKIRISINNKINTEKSEGNFKLPNKFDAYIGMPGKSDNKKQEFTFNGIIYPIIIFEIYKKSDVYSEMKQNILKVKNYYYLIAEKYFEDKRNSNINSSKDGVLIDNYKEYYGLIDKDNEERMKKISNYITQIVLYINPYVVTSTFSKKLKIYKDANIYEINEGKNKVQYSYEFNVVPTLDNGQIFAFKDNNLLSYLKINNGLIIITLEIETLYNYILLLNNNGNYMNIVNDNKEEFYKTM